MPRKPKADRAAAGTEGGRDLGFERLLFFSDAVFAIAVTLLTLDIGLPDIPRHLARVRLRPELLDLGGSLLVYVFSFFVVGSLWVAHHSMFRIIRRYDAGLLGLNLMFLLFIAALPIPTRILGNYPNVPESVVFYLLFMIMASLVKALMWSYATSNHRLIDSRARLGRTNWLGYAAPAAFLALVPVALVSPLAAEIACPTVWLLHGLERQRVYHQALES